MEFLDFSKTALYISFSKPMKLASFMLIQDPKNYGYTYTQLRHALNGLLSAEDVSDSLEFLMDRWEVTMTKEKIGERYIPIYRLDPVLLQTPLKKLVDIIDEGRRNG